VRVSDPSHEKISDLSDDRNSIIAVPGAGAHPDETWEKKFFEDYENRTKGSEAVNWLSDDKMLPAAIPKARIMSFGYDSQWYGPQASKVRLSNVAEELLYALQCERVVSLFLHKHIFRHSLSRIVLAGLSYLLVIVLEDW
jgi:hypothetical protein